MQAKAHTLPALDMGPFRANISRTNVRKGPPWNIRNMSTTIKKTVLPGKFHSAVVKWQEMFIPDYGFMQENWKSYFPHQPEFELCALHDCSVCPNIEVGLDKGKPKSQDFDSAEVRVREVEDGLKIAGREAEIARIEYADAIEQAGGTPLMLPLIDAAIPRYLELRDGFVTTGGDDPIMESFGCATHSLPGQMPLEVKIRDADGEILNVLRQFC